MKSSEVLRSQQFKDLLDFMGVGYQTNTVNFNLQLIDDSIDLDPIIKMEVRPGRSKEENDASPVTQEG